MEDVPLNPFLLHPIEDPLSCRHLAAPPQDRDDVGVRVRIGVLEAGPLHPLENRERALPVILQNKGKACR